MRAGELIFDTDPEYPSLYAEFEKTMKLVAQLNSGYHTPEEIRDLLGRIWGQPLDESVRMFPPFYTNFGKFTRVGRGVFINFGCTFLDRGGITLEDGVFIGPGVLLVTENHPEQPAVRRNVYAKPIVVGHGVWIGAGAVILPGVTIGEHAVVGARSHRNQGRACRGNRGRQSGSYREKYKNGIKLSFMKIGIIAAALAFVGLSAVAQTNQKTNMDMKKLELVQEWDKTFPKSDKVEHSKVVFVNRFGVTLAADMYVPKEVVGKLSAVAVSGPFGAVKEQSSGLYAQALAERGFLTIAFDPSFTGESGGVPRNVASPDINTEDFSAAVDFLANEDRVDPERIGILGICGWGGFAINAAANDTRIKVTVASTMYDISRCTANGYFDQADNADARYEMRRRLNAQRTEDYRNGSYVRAGGVVDPVPADAPQFVRDYHAYYKTSRGYHARSLNSTQGWNATSNLAFLNAPILAYAAEIRSAVMVVHGEKAHSRYMGEDAFKKLQGDNKRLLIVPGANHTDLYDKMEIIPFDEIAAFYREYLK